MNKTNSKHKKNLMSLVAILIAAIMILVVFNTAVIGNENYRIIDKELDEPKLAYRSQMESTDLLASEGDSEISTVDSSLSRTIETEEDKYELANEILINAVYMVSEMTDEEIEAEQDKMFKIIEEKSGEDVAILLDQRNSDIERAKATLRILGYKGELTEVGVTDTTASIEDKPAASYLSSPLMNTYKDLGLTLDEIEQLLKDYKKSKTEETASSLTSEVDSSKLKRMPRDGIFSSNAASSAASTLASSLNQELVIVAIESAGFSADAYLVSDVSNYNSNPSPTPVVEPYAIPDVSRVNTMPECEWWDNLFEFLWNLFLDIICTIIDWTVIIVAGVTAVVTAITGSIAWLIMGTSFLGFFNWMGAFFSDLFDGEWFQDTIFGEILWCLFNFDNFFGSFISAFTWSWDQLVDFWTWVYDQLPDDIKPEQGMVPDGTTPP